jgi:hypothetical protein
MCHGWPVEQLDALKVHNNFEGLGRTCDAYFHCGASVDTALGCAMGQAVTC